MKSGDTAGGSELLIAAALFKNKTIWQQKLF
jgi:hypothetical protein